MRTFNTIAALVIGSLTLVFGQLTVINVPPAIPACGSFRIEWTGGTPVYIVCIFTGPYEETSPKADVFHVNETTWLWDVDMLPGTPITINVTDSNNVYGVANSTIGPPDPNSNCPPLPPPAPPLDSSISSSALPTESTRPVASTTNSNRRKKAIVGGAAAAVALCVIILFAAIMFYRRSRRRYPPASRAPPLSKLGSKPGVSRSIYAKMREAQLERDIHALQEQIDQLRLQTKKTVALGTSPPLHTGNVVEHEILVLKRQMNGMKEEMGELREEREALRGLGCGSDTSSIADDVL